MNLFIACSSSNNIDSKYLEDSYLLLKELLKDNDLVYGAYNNGIMKVAYDLAKSYNRKIVAITTNNYEDELNDIDCEYKQCTDNIYRRSEALIEQSDIIVILPGGIGTITELISSIETMRNSEFNKPILIYNMYGFFDEFLEFMDKIYKLQFSNMKDKLHYQIFDSKDELIKCINDYKEV